MTPTLTHKPPPPTSTLSTTYPTGFTDLTILMDHIALLTVRVRNLEVELKHNVAPATRGSCEDLAASFPLKRGGSSAGGQRGPGPHVAGGPMLPR